MEKEISVDLIECWSEFVHERVWRLYAFKWVSVRSHPVLPYQWKCLVVSPENWTFRWAHSPFTDVFFPVTLFCSLTYLYHRKDCITYCFVYLTVYLPVFLCSYLPVYLTLHVYSFCRRNIQTRLPVLFSTLLPNVPRLFLPGDSACHRFFVPLPSIYLAPVTVRCLLASALGVGLGHALHQTSFTRPFIRR